eukprot:6801169-Pyramimonas_sp.AAC.1
MDIPAQMLHVTSQEVHPKGKPKGTSTATPRTSPGVRSGQNFEANPAVATRASQATPKKATTRQ